MTALAKLSAAGITLCLGTLCLGLTACASSSTPASAPTNTSSAASTSSIDTRSSSTGANSPASTVSPSPKITTADACALITEQDATTALGVDPGHGSTFSSHGSTQCQYGTYQTAFVLVNLTPTNGRAGYDLVRANQKPGDAATIADISGVGDRAFEVSGHNTAGIFFNRGDAVVTISVTIQTATSPPHAVALSIAKLAASRL
jgi:hypothetical protein